MGTGRRDAIIVGARICGITTALALRQRGISVTVYERSPEVSLIGAGMHLASNGLLALQRLGIGDTLQAKGSVLGCNEFLDRRGRLLTRMETGRHAARRGVPPTIGITRGDLQQALLDALDGEGVIHTGRECAAVREDDGRAVAVLADGEQPSAEVLIGADGIDSAIRARLVGSKPPRDANRTGFRAVVDHQDRRLSPDRFRSFFGRGCRFTVYPVGGGRMYWLATLVDQERALDPAGRAGYMRDAFAGFAPQVRELIEATDPASIVQSRIRDRDPIGTWGSGRITLLGDAIHPSTPDVGQGACQAMEDAVVLAARLADAPDAVAGLRAYEEQRRRRAASNAERRSSLLFGN